MKRILFTAIFLIVSSVSADSAKKTDTSSMNCETIDDILQYVRKNNPKLFSRKANLGAVSTLKDQACSNYLPKIEAVGSLSAEHRNYKNSLLNGSFTDNVSPYAVGLGATVNLYEGGRTESAIKIAEQKKSAEQFSLSLEEQNICLQATAAYVSYMDALSVLNLMENNKLVMQAHHRECKERVSLGKGTMTDLAQSEAGLAKAESQLIGAEVALKNAKEHFISVVGKAPAKLQPIDVSVLADRIPKTLEEAERTAIRSHPLITQQRILKQIAEENINVAKSGLSPTVNARVSAIHQRKQIMIDKHSKYQAELTVNVPIYDGNISDLKTKEANFQLLKHINDMEQTKTDIIERVHIIWNEIQRHRSEIMCAETQIKANQRALEGVKDEAINGARTTLDVLNAEQALKDSRVELSHAKHGLIIDYFSLLQAIGKLDF